MRRFIGPLCLVVAAAGCSTAADATQDSGPRILVKPSPTPFTDVQAGPVRASIPDGWIAVPTPSSGPRQGFLASPHPQDWRRMDGRTAGLTATWVDATQVGVPSDYYYLAARGPLLGKLIRSRNCAIESQRVFVDRRPAFAHGSKGSPGDYVARGEGVCDIRGTATRWGYFVAAPGFGPTRRIGIPESGLYVVVAMLPDSKKAPRMVERLLYRTTFGGARMSDFVSALESS